MSAESRGQSPVDIAGYARGDAEPLSFSYHSKAIAVRNDGQFVHVDYPPGNTFSVGQRTFRLETAHLHSPAEHQIDGAGFAAELHLVHADDEGSLAVVGMLFRPGPANPMIQAILDAAPAVVDTVTDGLALDASGYLSGPSGYYRYVGSKTTPPFDEPVNWFVMRRIETISREQVDSLLSLSGGPNNRDLQPIGDRAITEVC